MSVRAVMLKGLGMAAGGLRPVGHSSATCPQAECSACSGDAWPGLPTCLFLSLFHSHPLGLLSLLELAAVACIDQIGSVTRCGGGCVGESGVV